MDTTGADVSTRVGSDETASDGVLAAVAALTDTEPAELPPLYRSVDPDALDRLSRGPRDADLRVTFDYAECRVEVAESGHVAVSARGD